MLSEGAMVSLTSWILSGTEINAGKNSQLQQDRVFIYNNIY